MKRFRFRSFRLRLFFAFLAVSLVPLALCSAMLLQIFRMRLTGAAEETARAHLDNVLQTMDTLHDGVLKAVSQLQGEPLVAAALSGTEPDGDATQVYSRIYQATEGLREYARFDLYDQEGRWRYSTQGAPAQLSLPTDWGVLGAAARGPGLVLTAAEDVADTSRPLLQGGAALTDRYGRRIGYLVASLDHAGLRRLLEGKYGAQDDLILLSRYWRPVYCAQPSLAVSLAPRLRRCLLDGRPLESLSEDFLYSVAQHPATGLYLVLRRPQVFTGGTLRLLYTVSLGCALVCLGVSIAMSLKLSGQLSQPIQRLRQGFGEVGNNNLEVRIPQDREDELGELAQRFNAMVAALRRNQAQLVENQRELNEAQIRMLQAQLNPHFLCNTLDTMKWISKLGKVPQVALMSTNLADILRFCVSPEEFVPLRREAGILERYIEIQRIRLSGAFDFSVDLPQELADCLVPKMILQPMVENAILHGLEGMEGGKVRVEAAETEDGLLRVTVADNGKGLPPELLGPFRQERSQCRGHLGLYNVNTILVKYYGEGSRLDLAEGPGGAGAVITALLPIRREEKTEC